MLNKIRNFFSPKESGSNENKLDNIVDNRTELIKAIVTYFQPFYGKDTFTDSIVIWVGDEQQLYQSEVRGKDFEDVLRKAFDDAKLKAVANAPMRFETQNPPQETPFPEISNAIFIELRPAVEQKKTVCHKARISIAGGMGSLVQDEYILDAANTNRKVFNIGRGEMVKTDRGYRTNHIAIKENDPSQTQSDRNKYVSSTHANIIFKANAGFYLQALPGGCRSAGGNATKTIRDEAQPDEIRDLNTLRLLQDGDLIELGKSVLLKFEEITADNQ